MFLGPEQSGDIERSRRAGKRLQARRVAEHRP